MVPIRMGDFSSSIATLNNAMWTPVILISSVGTLKETILICTVFNEDDKSISWLVFQVGKSGLCTCKTSGSQDNQIKCQLQLSVRNEQSEVRAFKGHSSLIFWTF